MTLFTSGNKSMKTIPCGESETGEWVPVQFVQEQQETSMTEDKSTTDWHISQATERLRRSWAGKDVPEYNANPSLAHDDMVLVVPAYLDENPADDNESLTVEWLEGIGFAHGTHGSWEITCDVIRRLSIRYNGGLTQLILGTGGHMGLPVSKTRGDVRRLCKALGVELTETSVS